MENTGFMKKFLSLFLCILYFMSINACYAFEELYYIKNIDKNTASSQIKEVLADEEFDIKNENPLHAISKKKAENFAIMVLQQSGENLFYYYESNDKNKKLNKKILKKFKKNDIEYEQSEDASLLTNFADIVYRYNTGTKKVYSFEEPKQPKEDTIKKQAQQQNIKPTTMQGFAGKIRSGVRLNGLYKGYTVAPQGSILTGSLVKASPAKHGSRNGSVDIVFTKLITPNGKTLDISTQNIEFSVTNEGKVKSAVTATVGMAVAGALIGLAIAALTGDTSQLAKGAIIGASVGGGTALVSNVAQKGVDAEIPAFTDIEIILNKPVSVVLTN